MPSRSIIRTGVGPHREPGNRFPAMAAINLLAARAARVQSRRNLSRSLSPKLDHSHSITRFDRSRTGPKGNGLKQQIEAGQYPGFVKTTLDGVDQRDYLEGKSEKSARDYFFYFSGATPSAVRYKNWKMYYTMSQPGPAGWIMPLTPFHFTLVQNIKRDPFEQSVGVDQKSAMSMGGALGAPATAFQYDWNLLPIGQQLWLEHLSSYEKFPPLQAPESYNLSGVLEQVKKANASHASD